MAEKTKQKKQKYLGYPTSVRFRCDDTIVQWLEQLANEAGRNPSSTRDLVHSRCHLPVRWSCQAAE